MAFPKIIHFIWYQGRSAAPPDLREIPDLWAKLNPGWRVMFWDETTLTRFLRTHYLEHFQVWKTLASVIKKCDFARLLLLFHFGGCYADMDLTPYRSLYDFLNVGEVRHRLTFTIGQLPQPDPVERVNFAERELILTREYKRVLNVSWPVANGITLAKERNTLWLDFLRSRMHDTGALVLDYLGPWALSRFINSRTGTLAGKCTVLPPYVFLWEPQHLKQPRPEWVVSTHAAKNYWGDHSKPDWWSTT